MRSFPSALRATALMGIALGAAACTPDFDPAWLVKDLRILAVQAEPPEVLVSAPAPSFPPVTVRALVVDPLAPQGALFDWKLWVCTGEESHCGAASRRQLVREARSSLGEIQAELRLPLDLFLAALQADVAKGFGGVPVMTELEVKREGFADRAVKRVVYGVPLPPQKTANANPHLGKLLVDGKEPGPSLEVEAGQVVKLLPAPAAGARESYWVATFTGGERQLQEFLSYYFFTTAGELSDQMTGGKPSPFVERKKVDEVSSDWTALAEPGPAELWVVVRDDRGGVSWTRLEAQVR